MGSAAAKVLRFLSSCARELWFFAKGSAAVPSWTRASPWDLSGTWTFARRRRKARETCENRGVANTPRNRVQHCETPATPVLCEALDGFGNYAAWAAACCRITSRKISPYCRSFASPTPCTADISAAVVRLRRGTSVTGLSREP